VLGRFKGAGIGLFETKSVLAGHGGQLVFTSTEGTGSTFTLRLPC
jgi:signal transduction histidine kinase